MKKKKLIIVGAGSVGGYISYNIQDFGAFEIIGFLDDDARKLGKTFFNYEVLGSSSDLYKYNVDGAVSVVVGIANPEVRRAIVKKLIKQNPTIDFPSFISSRAWVSPGVISGIGAIIYPGVTINFECLLEDFVIINMNCALGHNCSISSFSTLAPGVSLGGFTYVGNGSELCIGVSTRQGIQIGNQVLIGGQSMVVKNIPSKVKVMGVPAHVYKSKLPTLEPQNKEFELKLLNSTLEHLEFNKSS